MVFSNLSSKLCSSHALAILLHHGEPGVAVVAIQPLIRGNWFIPNSAVVVVYCFLNFILYPLPSIIQHHNVIFQLLKFLIVTKKVAHTSLQLFPGCYKCKIKKKCDS